MGFISSMFGAKNDFQGQEANLDNTDYSGAASSALNGVGPVDNSQGNQTRAMQNQFNQALMQQLQGNGPSVAQTQLAQTTDANNRATAGMIGSQRGVNPALAAREILQNNAAQNQSAAGQGATLRANEQQSAQGQLGSNLGNQRTQDIGQAQGTASTNASTAGTLGGLQNTQNANKISNLANAQGINAATSAQNANTNGQIAGGILGAVGGAMSGGAMGGKWKGGPVGYSDGGGVAPIMAIPDFIPKTNPWAKSMKAAGKGAKDAMSDPTASPLDTTPVDSTGGTMGEAGGLAGGQGEGPAAAMMFASNGGTIPNFDEGGDVAPIAEAPNWAGAGAGIGAGLEKMGGGSSGGGGGGGGGGSSMMSMLPMLAMMASRGGNVPGKAPVSGDSPKNDVVPTMLSPGEDVLPRSVTEAKNAPEKAKEFVAALMREKQKKESGGSDKGYGRVLQAQRMLHDRLAAVERHFMGGKVGK